MKYSRMLIAALALVIAASVGLSACGEKLPSAEEIVDDAIEAQNDIRIFRLDADARIASTVPDEDGEVTIESAITHRGFIDQVEQQIEMIISLDMTLNGEPQSIVDSPESLYILNGRIYGNVIPITGEAKAWTQVELEEGYWESLDIFSFFFLHQEALDTAEVTVTGTEEVKGVDCYVLELEPPQELLMSLMVLHLFTPSYTSAAYAFYLFLSDFTTMPGTGSLTIWLAKDTLYITKTAVDISVVVVTEAGDSPEEGAVVDISLEMFTYDHNQPVTVVLPQEAIDAPTTSE